MEAAKAQGQHGVGFGGKAEIEGEAHARQNRYLPAVLLIRRGPLVDDPSFFRHTVDDFHFFAGKFSQVPWQTGVILADRILPRLIRIGSGIKGFPRLVRP
jgi:hypothetical protein